MQYINTTIQYMLKSKYRTESLKYGTSEKFYRFIYRVPGIGFAQHNYLANFLLCQHYLKGNTICRATLFKISETYQYCQHYLMYKTK